MSRVFVSICLSYLFVQPAAWGRVRLSHSLILLPEELSHRPEHLDVIADDFGGREQRHGDDGAGNAPDVPPEQQLEEHRHKGGPLLCPLRNPGLRTDTGNFPPGSPNRSLVLAF